MGLITGISTAKVRIVAQSSLESSPRFCRCVCVFLTLFLMGGGVAHWAMEHRAVILKLINMENLNKLGIYFERFGLVW